jgi:two-component system chemotaxis response regulator CheB
VTGGANKIRVLITEDSPVARELLKHILGSDPQIVVMGTAHDGFEALEFVCREKPDVITMDVNMPRMTGFEATRRIMEVAPVPIVICSASWKPTATEAFRAIEAGALAVIEKPVGPGHPKHEAMAKALVETVKRMSEVRVVKRWTQERLARVQPAAKPPQVALAADVKIVAIGASTGGPPVVHTILSGLPKHFPVPVVVVQHIAAGFLEGMADWLRQRTGLHIHIPVHGDRLQPGHVYLAPDGFQMGVDKNLCVVLNRAPAENGLRPSVSYLFRSLAGAFGPAAVGVLLTGMGRDGAAELKLMRDKGAVTIAQDKQSATVDGMPGAARELDAAVHVLPPDRIAPTLHSLVHRTRT